MIYEHNGYTLVQEEEENHHYMIFNGNGKWVMHASCECPLSEEEAKERIEFYLDSCKRGRLFE